MRKSASINDRVAFLYAHAEGAANLGRVLEIQPCTTWGKIARVAWDDGDCGWVRHFDLVSLTPATPLAFWQH